jgi:xanthine phosphoribosyltransferase
MLAFSPDEIAIPAVDWEHLSIEPHSGQKVWYRPWSEYHQDCKRLAQKLQDYANEHVMKWWGMIVIPRGGLIGGGIIARELGIHNVQTLPMSLYNDTKLSGQQVQVLTQLNPLFTKLMRERGRGCIVFDDLVDTRQTNQAIRQQLGPLGINVHFATVYVKAGGEESVDSYVTQVPDPKIWVRHPWDLDYGHSEPISGPDGN